MPPLRKPPQSLLTVCLDSLCKHLTSYITRKLGKVSMSLFSCFPEAEIKFLDRCAGGKAELEDYLGGSLRWEVLARFLEDSSLGHDIRLAAFLLLRDPLQPCLSFGHFPAQCFPILNTILSSLHRLTKLSMRWVWLEPDQVSRLARALPDMPLLTQLVVPYIADDRLVAAVGRHCPKLQLLDLSGTEQVTEEGAQKLYRMSVGGELWPTPLISSLHTLLLGGPGGLRLAPPVVASLLAKLTSLITLGTYPQTGLAVTKALQKLGVSPNPRKHPGAGQEEEVHLQLQHLQDQGSTAEELTHVSLHCPRLTSLYLDTPGPGLLDTLHCFHALRDLKLNKTSLPSLLQHLQHLTSLASLELVTCTGTLDLGRLSVCCPRLKSLQLYYCASGSVASLTPGSLPCLTIVIIYSTPVSGAAALQLLQHSPALTQVTLSSASSLDLATLQTLQAAGSLQQVEELGLLEAPLLDLSCLEHIIETLPCLTLVGKLEGWNITTGQLEPLRQKLKRENYQVRLWYNLPMRVREEGPLGDDWEDF